jgi:putative Mn2+ efflux pump MntP
MAIIITGLATFFISMGGVKIGNIFGIKFKSKAEFLGGAVLIILGIKIVIEHLFFN